MAKKTAAPKKAAKKKPLPVAKKAPVKKKGKAKGPGYTCSVDEDIITSQLDDATAWEEQGGSAVAGQTYEEGVGATLRWITGLTEDPPIQETVEEDPDSEENGEEDDE